MSILRENWSNLTKVHRLLTMVFKSSIAAVFTVAILFLIPGCHKETDPNACIPSSTFPPNYAQLATGCFYNPYFNPNNPDQFSFIDGCQRDSTPGVYIYSLSQRTSRFCTPIVPTSDWPKWGKSGWIASGNNGQIYKVNPDGQQFSYITDSYDNWRPIFFPSGNLIVHLRQYPVTMVISDLNGNLVDSLVTFYGSGSVSYDSIIVTQQSDGSNVVAFYKPNPLRLIKTMQLMPGGTVQDMDWIPNTHKFVWCALLGALFITDYDTGNTTQIHSGCTSHNFASVSVSPDGQKIITSSTLYTVNNESKTITENNIIELFNIDGSNDTQVLP